MWTELPDEMADDGGAPVRVSAGIIRRNGRLLVCQRRPDQDHSLKWEFPGGKIEAGESPRECLRRELREELGIATEIGALVHTVPHRYPGKRPVILFFFDVDSFQGEPSNLTFADLRWVSPSELGDLDFLEADRELIAELASPRHES
jgi:8-oxo-dGTP diphosphatase